MTDIIKRRADVLRHQFFMSIFTKDNKYIPEEGYCDMIELVEKLMHDPEFDIDMLLKIVIAEWLSDNWMMAYKSDIIKKYTTQIARSRHC